jgi:predicted amidohydrolase
MRICAAQIKPSNGSIQTNIEIHKDWINLAISGKADFIAFPELSLTGYEPKLAKKFGYRQKQPGIGSISNDQ